MLRRLRQALLMASFLASPAVAADCGAVDFLTLPLPQGDPVEVALTKAYPGLTIAAGQVSLDGETVLPLGEDTGRSPQARLDAPSLREQFHDAYPLDFDLTRRSTAWHDPGRPRVEAFFMALYGGSEADVRASLAKAKVAGASGASFLMTKRQSVACQMAAALDEVQGLNIDWAPFFRNVGGSFNWRPIAGTSRMSAHSYGIAFDLNADLGGYWRWSGRAEGDAGAYDNKIPEAIVRAFERRGFVWGGKWHHFDGMHFEYRPEIILHARAISR